MKTDDATHARLSQTSPNKAVADKLILNLTYKCNNHCIFCSIAERPIAHADFGALCERLEAARAEGLSLLDLDGGEPTLYPELFPLLDRAMELGFTTLTLTSNGRRLADAAFMERLAKYPLNLLVSLHAAEEALHDQLKIGRAHV